MSTIYAHKMKRLDGKEQSLSEYKGKVLLIVNVASQCGNTPQYKGLQELHKKYHDKGLEILGFPANNFGAQEPGTEKEIAEFCSTKYGVTFPMFSKISAKGTDIHPLYQELSTNPNGGPVTWNFQKFLVDRKGNLVQKFTPTTKPDAPDLLAKVEELLKQA